MSPLYTYIRSSVVRALSRTQSALPLTFLSSIIMFTRVIIIALHSASITAINVYKDNHVYTSSSGNLQPKQEHNNICVLCTVISPFNVVQSSLSSTGKSWKA